MMKYLEILNFICQQFRRVKKKNHLSNTPAFKTEYKSVYISFISQVFC